MTFRRPLPGWPAVLHEEWASAYLSLPLISFHALVAPAVPSIELIHGHRGWIRDELDAWLAAKRSDEVRVPGAQPVAMTPPRTVKRKAVRSGSPKRQPRSSPRDVESRDGLVQIPLTETLWKGADVCKRLDMSRGTLERMIKVGTFPGPIKLETGAVLWLGSEVEAWFERAAKLPRVVYKVPEKKR